MKPRPVQRTVFCDYYSPNFLYTYHPSDGKKGVEKGFKRAEFVSSKLCYYQ